MLPPNLSTATASLLRALVALPLGAMIVGCGSVDGELSGAGGQSSTVSQSGSAGGLANAGIDAASGMVSDGSARLATGPAADASVAAPTLGDGAVDASRDGGILGASCAARNFLFCDDFEGATIDTTKWSVAGTSAQISTERVARGAQSLKLVFTPGKSPPVLSLSRWPAELRQHLFGRMLLWSEGKTPVFRNPGDNYDTFQHVEFFRAQSATSNYYLGQSIGVVGDVRLTSPNDRAVAIGPFSATKWMCIEWEFDAVEPYAHGWLNDGWRELSGESPHADPNWKLPNASSFASGHLGLIVITSTTPAMQVFIDEVTLDVQRIGCPP